MISHAYYQEIPCGAHLPLGNPHAFSVSIPTLQNIIDYQEAIPAVFEMIKTAYPRLVFHPYISSVLQHLRRRFSLDDSTHLYLLPSHSAAEHVALLSGTSPQLIDYKQYTVAVFPNLAADEIRQYYLFMKHCGYMIFSREAEDLLCELGETPPHFEEEYFSGDSFAELTRVLHDSYETIDREMVFASSGMNALYAAFEAVRLRGKEDGRTVFIQFGWLYSDSIHILKKCCEECVQFTNVTSLDEIRKYLAEHGSTVAGIVAETISNPLLETPDISCLADLAREYGIPFILDNTFATPWNVDVAPHCDLIVESLTKFASGRGDVLAGVLMRPVGSQLSPQILQEAQKFSVPLYERDAARLAQTIGGYQSRMERVNHNTAVLVEYFGNHPAVESIHHVYQGENSARYKKIARREESFGGVLSIVFSGDFAAVYDRVCLPKGPSFGSDFPLVMAYTLLAHYDMTKTKEGQESLDEIGLSTKLLRISVGEDEPKHIIAAFEAVLQG